MCIFSAQIIQAFLLTIGYGMHMICLLFAGKPSILEIEVISSLVESKMFSGVFFAYIQFWICCFALKRFPKSLKSRTIYVLNPMDPWVNSDS